MKKLYDAHQNGRQWKAEAGSGRKWQAVEGSGRQRQWKAAAGSGRQWQQGATYVAVQGEGPQPQPSKLLFKFFKKVKKKFFKFFNAVKNGLELELLPNIT